MANELLAVIYRPHEHAEEYIVFIDDEAEYKEWKAQPQGGKSIALARFIGNFEIYKSATGGVTGQLLAISKQELETDFFADDKKIKDKSIDAAIALILQNGREQRQHFKVQGQDLNASRGQGDVKPSHNSGR